jgi:hypothetical protein
MPNALHTYTLHTLVSPQDHPIRTVVLEDFNLHQNLPGSCQSPTPIVHGVGPENLHSDSGSTLEETEIQKRFGMS